MTYSRACAIKVHSQYRTKMYLPTVKMNEARTYRMIEDHSGSLNGFAWGVGVVAFPTSFSDELIWVIELSVVLKKLIFPFSSSPLRTVKRK